MSQKRIHNKENKAAKAAHKHTCGVAAAGSTAEGSPEGVSLAGASELHHKIKFFIKNFKALKITNADKF